MDAKLIAGLGRSLFGVLVGLLRPTVRDDRGGVAVDAKANRLLPLQRGVLTVDCDGDVAQVTVDQTFVNLHSLAIRPSYCLPLPPDAVVVDLELRPPNRVALAQAEERTAAREFFNLMSRTGHPAVLVTEDAPGVVSQDVIGLLAGCSLRAVLRFAYRLADGALGSERLRLRVHLDAAATALSEVPIRRPLLRLGGGRQLDGLFGIRSPAAARLRALIPGRMQTVGDANAVGSGAIGLAGMIAQFLPSDEGDVLVSSDGPQRCAAAWRGDLGGRRVRVVASVQPAPGPPSERLWDGPVRDLSRLMRRYIDAPDGEAARRLLVSRIAEHGLRHRLLTMWTSLIATPRLPDDGERCPAAAALRA